MSCVETPERGSVGIPVDSWGAAPGDGPRQDQNVATAESPRPAG